MSDFCPTCGAKTVKYRHNINKTLVKCLISLHRAGGTAAHRELDLNFTQRNNFQKLRYWGLIKLVPDTIEWSITADGVNFLHGELLVPKTAITFRGEAVDFEGPKIHITEAIVDHIDWWRENYWENRVK